jgi:hypothetical protein
MGMPSKDESLETSLIFNVFQLTFIILNVSDVDSLSGPLRYDSGMPSFNKWRSHNRVQRKFISVEEWDPVHINPQQILQVFFYRCTVHLDNIKISFHQQMHLLLHMKIVKIYIKISYIRSYMFRSTWIILRELMLSLAKVTLCRINQ